jgi:probable rRNA maturation factor
MANRGQRAHEGGPRNGLMILNQQRQVRVRVAALDDFLSRACRAVRVPRTSLTVCLVSGARMARWNAAYRGKRGATDVLSFGSADDSKGTAGSGRTAKSLPRKSAASYWGDIAICPAVARRNARRLGRTLDGELRILILHGILHLMGYDHERDSGQMERRERRLRRALGVG